LQDEERRRRRTAAPITRDDCLSAAFALAAANLHIEHDPAAIAEEALRIARAIEVRSQGDRYGAAKTWGGARLIGEDNGLLKRRRVSHAGLSLAEEVALTEMRVRLLPPCAVEIADEVIETYFKIVGASPNGFRNWDIMKRRMKREPIKSIAKDLRVSDDVVKQTPKRQYAKIGRALESLMPSSPKFVETAARGDSSEKIADNLFEPKTSRNQAPNSKSDNVTPNIVSGKIGILDSREFVIQNSHTIGLCYNGIRGDRKSPAVNFCPAHHQLPQTVASQ
jgi:hypothetical protein